MGDFMSQGYDNRSSADGGFTQNTDASIKIGLENVNMDNSTKIGLQGDDLAVVAQAMVNQQITSQTALLSSQQSGNSALAQMVASNNATKNQIMNALQGAGKWILYVGLAGVGLWAFSKFYKR